MRYCWAEALSRTGQFYSAIIGQFYPGVDNSNEIIFDAIHNEQKDWRKYLLFDKEAITDLSRVAPEGNIVVHPEMHASAAVRHVLGSMLRPIQADEIFAERVDIKKIGLYFRPVYAFEYKWETKGKTAVAEFDGLTGIMTTGGITLRKQVEKVITRDLIFDVGAMSANMLNPWCRDSIQNSKGSRRQSGTMSNSISTPELRERGRQTPDWNKGGTVFIFGGMRRYRIRGY